MRGVFVGSGVLVVLAGLQLALGPGETERGFVWTIRPDVTASALGGFYLAVVLLTFLSARQTVWANARIFVPGTLVFATLILVATLIHVDRFHWEGPTAYAQFQALLWIAVYAVYPVVLAAAWIHQRRHAAPDPPRQAPLQDWYRIVAGTQGAVFLALGGALLVAPVETADAVWPWELTPLTGRAFAAWFLGLGVILLHALHENDWIRIPAAAPTYTAVGAFQVLVALRYAGDLDWGGASAWAHLLWFAGVAAVGACGLVLSARARPAHVPAGAFPG
jgi:hypothetical protein